MARITEAIRRRLAPTPTERETHINQRRALTDVIRQAVSEYEIDDEPVEVVRIENDYQGPLGGLSDRMNIKVGRGEYARHFVINVYAYGQMAEID